MRHFEFNNLYVGIEINPEDSYATQMTHNRQPFRYRKAIVVIKFLFSPVQFAAR